MSYTVIHAFTDLQDENHVYLVGDKFPHDNKVVAAERVKELTGTNNKVGEPLIKTEEKSFSQYMNSPEKSPKEELPFVDVPQVKTYTKTEINRMSTAELKEFATEQGIANANDMTGAKLKEVLIKKMGL